MKKVNQILLILISLAGTTYAQTKPIATHQDQEPVLIAESKKKSEIDVRIPIMKAIGSSMNSDELHKINKNAVHIMSVGVSFNDQGVVDTVYLSKMLSPEISQILKPGTQLTKKVRQGLKSLGTFKSKVVVFPVLIFNANGNGVDYNQIMLKEFVGIWPGLNVNDQKKPLILLEPFLNGFFRIVN
ncbi:hypothetical protein [Pedobacter sp. MC2016-24]|uniref:hypothetical protein n=1 Tax=Pedobacter sp. MC2016-24 TaxID=2780090 RepID=UPI00187E91DC|nr:hypothetical protein [Pedobacter sp. MC2016-24]MBE9603187.1 hypothetical protein [Pedobacter sp. MC2016-24]